jgi:hypothetical protein
MFIFVDYDDPTLNMEVFIEEVKNVSPSTKIFICSSFSLDVEAYEGKAEILEKPFDEKDVRNKLASQKMLL